MLCIYCSEKNPSCGFSDEHIWPDRLGGSLLPKDLFRSNAVCRKCNSLCGLYVDGAFIKSFFATSENVTSANAFPDPKKPSAVPLTYLGFASDVDVEKDEVCERWIGPAGDHIYFFHKRDRENWNSFAGGDILSRKREDKGYAYMYLTSEFEFWQKVAYYSFRACFLRARRLVLNASLSPDQEWSSQDYDILPLPDGDDMTQRRHIKAIKNVSNLRHTVSPVIDMYFDRRFLAKLALGIGVAMFGDDFSECHYAEKLRSELWPACASGNLTGVKYKPYISECIGKHPISIYGVSGVWALTIYKTAQSVYLIVGAPTGKDFGICMHPNWEQCGLQFKRELEEGETFLIAPKIGKMWGPIETSEVLRHNLGKEISRVVSNIISQQTQYDQLPPKENGI